MPTKQRVDEFVRSVVSDTHVRVIAEFYHETASMQENFNPVRQGRGALLAYEAHASNNIQSMDSFPPHKVLVDGNNVAIHWTFELVDSLGQRRRLEEIALQEWHGDRIITERFFYDSAKAWQPVE